jgi:hypothetical protein
LKVRFLADANFNQSRALIRESAIDFVLPQAVIPDKMSDSEVPDLAEFRGRVLISNDLTTMPRWFDQCVEERSCAGRILVPDKLPTRDVIEDLLLV